MAIKVMLGVPFSGRFVPPEWAMSLAAIEWPAGTSHSAVMIKGNNRELNRTRLVKAAQKMGAQYILMLDDDTAPPYDVVRYLTNTLDQADDDVAVAAGIYTTKVTPCTPIVYKERHMGPFWRWKYGEVFETWGIGTGCMMIRMSVFDRLPEPWFRDIHSLEEAKGDPIALPPGEETPQGGFSMSDDLYFCEKLKQHGYKVLAHGGVLPLHFSQDGKAHRLPNDSFPLKDVDPSTLWYRHLI